VTAFVLTTKAYLMAPRPMGSCLSMYNQVSGSSASAGVTSPATAKPKPNTRIHRCFMVCFHS
jgi:hypothetical protein